MLVLCKSPSCLSGNLCLNAKNRKTLNINSVCAICLFQTGTALKDRIAEGLAASPVSMEAKVSNGQQALLQHLLLKEQRQQRMMSPGEQSTQEVTHGPSDQSY